MLRAYPMFLNILICICIVFQSIVSVILVFDQLSWFLMGDSSQSRFNLYTQEYPIFSTLLVEETAISTMYGLSEFVWIQLLADVFISRILILCINLCVHFCASTVWFLVMRLLQYDFKFSVMRPPACLFSLDGFGFSLLHELYDFPLVIQRMAWILFV